MANWRVLLAVVFTGLFLGLARGEPPADDRMDWWREARFGLFIHWGLYSTLEGEWEGEDWHAEWIRTTAQIPVEEYRTLLGRFNPVDSDADAWCRMASDAGMKYIVITSKHHDGFCLFDSDQTDFDVMSTPFKRDIMAELADAAARHGLRIGWYHSIMDWNHPDYLPRRGWEAADRPAAGADFRGRFVPYLRAQVRELLTNYGDIGVMWFDGEWEETWTPELGNDLYAFCREIQPRVIVNNRVSKGREGMAGLTRAGGFAGDFGTPEQEVPATGLPGIDWESCITMNDHWGWNRSDEDWKSSEELVGMLCDIASKGGNLLLNVGPMPDGTFPPEAVERLAEIGRWMRINGESIHGTEASPIEALPWGRCTMRREGPRTTLYFQVFETGRSGIYLVPGLASPVLSARLLGAEDAGFEVSQADAGVGFFLPPLPEDAVVPVVAVEIDGEPVVYNAPRLEAPSEFFVGEVEVRVAAPPTGGVVRYSTDGSMPGPASPIAIGSIRADRSCVITARIFVGDEPVSAPRRLKLERVEPLAGRAETASSAPGLTREVYPGSWERLPDFDTLTPARVDSLVAVAGDGHPEHEAWRLTGWLRVDEPGLHRFALRSDDGARLDIHGRLVVDNDGLHASLERSGEIALGAGWHPIRIGWFNRTGAGELRLLMGPAGGELEPVDPDRLRHER